MIQPTRSSTPDGSVNLLPSFIDAVLFHAATEPSSPAIGTEAGILSFGELAAAIRAATARCHAAGLKPGSLVGLIIGDPIWHICLIAALYRIGVASVSAAPENGPLLSAMGAAAVLHDGNRPVGYDGQCLHVAPDWFTAQSTAGSPALTGFAAMDLCRVALSSGTTGTPKPVAMSPQIIWDRLTTYLFRGSFAASDRIYCGPQLHSHYGFAVTFAALSHGKMVSFFRQCRSGVSTDVVPQGRSRGPVSVPGREVDRKRAKPARRTRRVARDPDRRRSDVRRSAASHAGLFPTRILMVYASTRPEPSRPRQSNCSAQCGLKEPSGSSRPGHRLRFATIRIDRSRRAAMAIFASAAWAWLPTTAPA